MKLSLPHGTTLSDLDELLDRPIPTYQQAKNRRLSELLSDPLGECKANMRPATLHEIEAEVKRSITMARSAAEGQDDLLSILGTLEETYHRLKNSFFMTVVSFHALSFMTPEQITETLRTYGEKMSPSQTWMISGKEGNA